MRAIPGFDGFFATEDGKIVSMRSGQAYELKQRLGSRGYLVVTLPSGSKKDPRVQRYVHTLVLLAFVGPRPEGMEACHFNGCRTDNALINLRWGTHRENVADALRHGTLGPGMCATHRRFDESQVLDMRARARAGELFDRIAERYATSATYIRNVVRGSVWKCLPI